MPISGRGTTEDIGDLILDDLGLGGLPVSKWKIGESVVSSVVVRITSEMARVWLERRNPSLETDRDRGNRSRTESRVNSYAEQMRLGMWRVSPQSAISFDDDGYLLDGQHRLMAITRIDEPVEFMVQVGWPRESFAVIDNGIIRKAPQLLSGKHKQLRTAAVRVVAARTGIGGVARDRIGVLPLNPEEELRWLSDWPEITALADQVNKVREATRINGPIHLAVMAMASRTKHSDSIDTWLASLHDGAGLAADDPRLQLRNRFTTKYRSLNMASGRIEAYVLIVRSWNKYVTGGGIGKLGYNPGRDSIPDVIGFQPVRGIR